MHVKRYSDRHCMALANSWTENSVAKHLLVSQKTDAYRPQYMNKAIA